MASRDRFGLVGNTIAGTFRVDEVVAEGGFGIIYRAFHQHFRSAVALKCLKIPVELSEQERQDFLEQFRSEAEVMFRLSASLPNIVRPLHVDAVHTAEGVFVPLMALEWLEGETFEKIIEHRTFADEPAMSLTEVITLLTPVAQALHEAHHFRGPDGVMAVVHRDIKPDNLLLTTIGGAPVVKILDFGISKVRRTASQLAGHFSQTGGQAPFSPAYGAPEQWLPKRYGQTGSWTDVWGLALTLVEIIKGDAVISGDHQAMLGTAVDLKKRPTPMNEGVNVTHEIESVFEKALAVDPRFRYQSIKAFWDALQAAVQLSGDPTAQALLTPSGKFALPPMSAPKPWTQAKAPGHSESPGGTELPPMMGPGLHDAVPPDSPYAAYHGAAASRDANDLSLFERLDPLAPDIAHGDSFPIDPSSGLAPLPAAPSTWHDDDLSIPSLNDEGEHPHQSSDDHDVYGVESQSGTIEVLTSDETGLAPGDPRHELHRSRSSPRRTTGHGSLSLELQPTSAFPLPGNASSNSPSQGSAAYSSAAYSSPARGSDADDVSEPPPLELEPAQPSEAKAPDVARSFEGSRGGHGRLWATSRLVPDAPAPEPPPPAPNPPNAPNNEPTARAAKPAAHFDQAAKRQPVLSQPVLSQPSQNKGPSSVRPEPPRRSLRQHMDRQEPPVIPDLIPDSQMPKTASPEELLALQRQLARDASRSPAERAQSRPQPVNSASTQDAAPRRSLPKAPPLPFTPILPSAAHPGPTRSQVSQPSANGALPSPSRRAPPPLPSARASDSAGPPPPPRRSSAASAGERPAGPPPAPSRVQRPPAPSAPKTTTTSAKEQGPNKNGSPQGGGASARKSTRQITG